MDAKTLKVLSSIGEPNLKRNGSHYGYNSMRLMSGERSDSRFRTLHNGPGGCRVDEFDENAKRIGSYVLPLDVEWGTRGEHTLSSRQDRIAYLNEAGSVCRYDLRDKKRTLLMENAVKDIWNINWMHWIGDDRVGISISCLDEWPNSGSVIVLPLNGEPPATLYHDPDSVCAIPSNDRRFILASLRARKCPDPDRLVIVDTLTGTEEPVAASDGVSLPLIGSDMAWSPDGSTVSFKYGYKVYSYFLDSKELRVLKEQGSVGNDWMFLDSIDNDRLCCLHCIGNAKELTTRFEIVDPRTGKTLISKVARNAVNWHIFANGNRVAFWDSESDPPKTVSAR